MAIRLDGHCFHPKHNNGSGIFSKVLIFFHYHWIFQEIADIKNATRLKRDQSNKGG